MPSLGRIILDPSKFFTFFHPSCEQNPTKEILQSSDINTFNPSHRCGLPLATYFSATKLVWLLENVKEVG